MSPKPFLTFIFMVWVFTFMEEVKYRLCIKKFSHFIGFHLILGLLLDSPTVGHLMLSLKAKTIVKDTNNMTL